MTTEATATLSPEVFSLYSPEKFADAVKRGSLDCVFRHLNAGFSVDGLTTMSRMNALSSATCRNFEEVIKLLRSREAQVSSH